MRDKLYLRPHDCRLVAYSVSRISDSCGGYGFLVEEVGCARLMLIKVCVLELLFV